LLFSWRRDFREGRLGGADFPDLVPAVVFPGPELPSPPVLGKAVADGRMEIVIGEDRRVIVNADVDGPALARVLKVLDRR
jgi:transposase